MGADDFLQLFSIVQNFSHAVFNPLRLRKSLAISTGGFFFRTTTVLGAFQVPSAVWPLSRGVFICPFIWFMSGNFDTAVVFREQRGERDAYGPLVETSV